MKKILGVLLMFLALTVFNSCEETSTTGSVIVKNSTGSSIIVDINDSNGTWKGERTLSDGNSTTYSNCEAGSVDGAARFVGGSTWYYSSTRSLSVGGSVTITWYPTKKSAEIGGLGEMINGEIIESSTEGTKE